MYYFFVFKNNSNKIQKMQALESIEDQMKLLVQTPDEFLQKFSLYNYTNQILIEALKQIPRRAIGVPSAVGVIYQLYQNDGVTELDSVLKVSNMCPGGRVPLGMLGQLCNMANNGDLIFRIPNTKTGKMTILGPNYILEALCGILLSRLKPFTPSFMHVKGFQYDNVSANKSIMLIQEKLSNINESIITPIDFLLSAFQIFQGLAVAQTGNRFVHYDLHQDNIMCRKIDKTVNIYEIGNGEYLYTVRRYEAVIIDYGHIRMETDESVLTPRLIFSHGQREILDYYDFNPYYDVYSFLITNLWKTRKKNFSNFQGNLFYGNPPVNAYIFLEIIILKLWEIFLNLPKDYVEKDRFSNPPYVNINNLVTSFSSHVESFKGSWRPKPELLSEPWTCQNPAIEIKRLSTPKQMMAGISQYLKKLDNGLKNPNEINYGAQLLTSTYFVSNQYSKPTDLNFKSKLYNLPMEQLDQTYYEYNISLDGGQLQSAQGTPISIIKHHNPPSDGFSWKDWSLQTEGLIRGNQHYHVAIIDVEKGIREGYTFRFDCCRLDMRTYFQDKNIESGLGINATFFQNSSTFLPLGEFRTDTDMNGSSSISDMFSSFEELPQDYKEWYGIIAIDTFGKLVMDNPENSGRYGNVLTCGPVLVWGGRSTVTSENIGLVGTWPRRINLNNPRFQCKSNSQGNINNCNNVIPGSLVHAANPNPRSAIGIRQDGGVVILQVEGRNYRGAGMEMEQLANKLVELNCHTAINLDGGRSSRLMWRNRGERVINQAGPTMSEAYPLGSIISFVKKK